MADPGARGAAGRGARRTIRASPAMCCGCGTAPALDAAVAGHPGTRTFAEVTAGPRRAAHRLWHRLQRRRPDQPSQPRPRSRSRRRPGQVEVLAPPAIVDGKRPRAAAVPALGEHDEALRAEFGAQQTAIQNERSRDVRSRRPPEIREAVAKTLRAAFPASTGASSTARWPIRPNSSTALTEAGYLSTLIPEEYGGAGLPLSAAAAILEEIQRPGCNGAACHAQMYIMGTLLRHGIADAEAGAICRRSPPANCACRPSASPSRRAAPTRPRSAPSPGARATITSSTARRSGRAAPSIPT